MIYELEILQQSKGDRCGDPGAGSTLRVGGLVSRTRGFRLENNGTSSPVGLATSKDRSRDVDATDEKLS